VQKKEANKLKLLDRTIFTYALSHLSRTDKVRFYYALKGRDGDSGLLSSSSITQLGRAVLLVDSKKKKTVTEFLTSWGCEFTFLPVLIRPTQTDSKTDEDTRRNACGGKRRALQNREESGLAASRGPGESVLPLMGLKARTGEKPARYPLKIGSGRTALKSPVPKTQGSAFELEILNRLERIERLHQQEREENAERISLLEEKGIASRRSLLEGKGNVERGSLTEGKGIVERRSLLEGKGNVGRRSLTEGKGNVERRSRIREKANASRAKKKISRITNRRKDAASERTEKIRGTDEQNKLAKVSAAIDLLIERQIAPREELPHEIGWIDGIPDEETADAGFYHMQELALIRQRRNTRRKKIFLETGQARTAKRQTARKEDETPLEKKTHRDRSAEKTRIDDGMEVRRTP